jgi:hypothetical protein
LRILPRIGSSAWYSATRHLAEPSAVALDDEQLTAVDSVGGVDSFGGIDVPRGRSPRGVLLPFLPADPARVDDLLQDDPRPDLVRRPSTQALNCCSTVACTTW